MKEMTKVELLKFGNNEYRIYIDDEDQQTIERYANEYEPDEDFEKRAIQQYNLSVISIKTFKSNIKVVRSENISRGSE